MKQFKIKSGEIIKQDCNGKIISREEIFFTMCSESRKTLMLKEGCKIVEEKEYEE